MPKKASVKKAKQQQQQQQQQQKQQQQQQQPQRKTTAATELSTFSLAAAIEEARASSHSSNTASTSEPQTQEIPQPRKIFNIPSPLRKKQTSQSYQSIATNSSYNTAHDSAQNTPAVSYFVDSSDDDNEPTVKDTAAAITSSSPTNSEIIFASNPEEETTMSIKSTKTTPVTKAAPSPVPIVSPPAAPKPVLVVAAPPSDPHYDVAQHVYAHAKDMWARGKTLPVLSHLLGITEAAANKLLEVALHTDLPAIDADVAAPNLKKLDDAVVTPVILKIWSILGPAVSRGEEMIVRPVVEEVLPKILESVGMGEKKENKTTEKGSSKVDDSPNPEYTSAPMVN